MVTEQGFLPVDGSYIYTLVHHHGERRPTVVILGAWGVSLSEPRYLLSELATRLFESGLNVVRYDHPGSGDSTGDPRAIGFPDLLAASAVVASLASTISDRAVSMIGYGVGSIVAEHFGTRSELAALAQIAPRSPGLIGEGMLEYSDTELVVPSVAASGREHDWWRLLYGEPVVPSQPPAPVSRRLVRTIPLQPATLSPRIRVGATTSDGEHHVREIETITTLDHVATPEQPSWHWNFKSRQAIVDGVTVWTIQALAAQPLRDLGSSSASAVPDLLQTTGQRSVTSFGEAGQAVRGILHRPVTGHSDLCVVYETGNPGQRVDIHGCGPLLSNALADRGLSSFRYDPRGMGVSDGSYDRMTWSERYLDHGAAVEFLHGLGFGSIAVVTNSAAARVLLKREPRRSVSGAVMWGPVLLDQGPRQSARLIRHRGGVATEFCGLPLGLAYSREEARTDYLRKLADSPLRLDVIFGAEEPDERNRDTIEKVIALRSHGSLSVVDGAHGFSWKGLCSAIEMTVGAVAAYRGAG